MFKEKLLLIKDLFLKLIDGIVLNIYSNFCDAATIAPPVPPQIADNFLV